MSHLEDIRGKCLPNLGRKLVFFKNFFLLVSLKVTKLIII